MRVWPGLAVVAALGAAGAVTLGRVGREAVPALDTLPGWAGGRPDVAACEAYIRGGLAAPATYRRAAITAIDSAPLDQAAFDREAGIAPPLRRGRRDPRPALSGSDLTDALIADLRRQQAIGHELRLRRLLIEYDADNAAGVTLRGRTVCHFRLRDGALDDDRALMTAADRATGKAALDTAPAALGKAPRRRPAAAIPCCL